MAHAANGPRLLLWSAGVPPHKWQTNLAGIKKGGNSRIAEELCSGEDTGLVQSRRDIWR